ncbi:MAG: hypothetical protein AAF500_13790 [Myxococcota bacterium]
MPRRFPMLLGLVRSVAFFCSFCLLLAACGGDSGTTGPVQVINIGGDDGASDGNCVQPGFPADQPDLSAISPPQFLLTTSQAQQSTSGQALVQPGQMIEATIPVNAATRRIRMELEDAWTPGAIIHTEEFETPGNEFVDVAFVPSVANRGRYYMRLTLCGFDCNEREVLFDLIDCDPLATGGAPPCGINAPYERSLFEGGELVQVDATCIDLGGTPGQGSGTILIQ